METSLQRTESAMRTLCRIYRVDDAGAYLAATQKQGRKWKKLREKIELELLSPNRNRNLEHRPASRFSGDGVHPRVIKDDRFLYDILCHPPSSIKQMPNVKRPRCVVCGNQGQKFCSRCEGTPVLCSGFCFVYYHHPTYPNPHDFEEWNERKRDIAAIVDRTNSHATEKK